MGFRLAVIWLVVLASGVVVRANIAPVGANDTYTTSSNTPLTITAPGVLGNDSDADGDLLTAVKLTDPAQGTVTLQADGSFVYTPDGTNGTFTFTYRANDGQADSNIVTVTIDVHFFAALDDRYTTPPGVGLTVPVAGVLANDVDVLGWGRTAVRDTNPAHGVLAFNANGGFTYTPNAGWHGQDSFTYHYTELFGIFTSNVATVILIVDQAPVAVANSYTTPTNTALIVAAPSVLGNDTDADGDPLTTIKVTNPAHGTATLTPGGLLSYTPNAGWHGMDSFTYQASDGWLSSNTVAVTILVDTAPVAVADSYQTLTNTVLTVPAATGVLANDTDIDADALTAAKVTNPAHGTVTLNANGSFTYTPNAGWHGTDTFTYQANDGWLDSNVTTVTIAVDAPPVAVNDGPYVANTGVVIAVAAPGVLANDTDADADPLTASKVTDPVHGVLVFNANGAFTYTPVAGWHGADSFTYKASDGLRDSNIATVALISDTAPVAVTEFYVVLMDTVLNVAGPGVLANDTDVDTDPLTAVKVTNPANGTLVLNANGSFTYTPNAGWHGIDTFTYKANDGFRDGNTVTVTIKVDAAPVAVDDGIYYGNTGVVITIPAPGVLANDTDADGDPITAVKVTDPAHGTLTLNADGSLTYTPTPGWHGADSFTYKANDGYFDSNVATVSIISDTAAVAVNDAYTTIWNTITVAAPGVLGNDSDADADPMTALLVTGPANGTLTLNPDGSFAYSPDIDFFGTDTFTYKVNDTFRDSNIATVTITVRPVSPWPEFSHDPAHTGRANTKLLATPKLQWSLHLPGAGGGTGDNPVHGAPSISPDAKRAFIGDNSGTLWAIHLQNVLVAPEQIAPSGARVTPFSGTPLVIDDIAAGYTVYAANRDGRVYWQHMHQDDTVDWGVSGAIPAPGVKPWGPLFGSPTSAVTVDGTTWVIVVTSDGAVYKINHATKTWTPVYSLGASFEASPAIGAPWSATYSLIGNGVNGATWVNIDGTNISSVQVGDAITITDTAVGTTQALGTVTGTTPAGQVSFTAPLAAAFPGATSQITLRRTPLYIGDLSGAVYALNLESGTLRWTTRYSGADGRAGGFSASPLINSGYLYLGDRGGRFLQLKEATGVATSVATPGASGAFTTACAYEELAGNKWLYAGCSGANGVIKLNVTNPTMLPPATMVNGGIASAVLAPPASGYIVNTATDPRLVLGGKDGVVYVLKDDDSLAGTWSMPGYQETLHATVIPVKRNAYILVFADGLVCYLTDTGVAVLPSKSPQSTWPQYQHDPLHTGAPGARDERFAAPYDIGSSAFDSTRLRWAVNTGGAVVSSAAHARHMETPRNNRQNPAGASVALVSMVQGENTLAFANSVASIFYVGDPLIIGDDYLGPITAISTDGRTVTTTYAAAATYGNTALVEVSALRVDRLQNLVEVYTSDTKVLCTAPERFLVGDVVKITDLSNPANTTYFTVGSFMGNYLMLASGQTVGVRITKANGYKLEAGLFYLTAGTPHKAAWMTMIGSDDGNLRAIDPDTGTVIWRNDVEQYLGAVRGSPAVDSVRGRIYVTALTGRLLAFGMNGQFLWAYPSLDSTPRGPIVSPPVLEDEVNPADAGMIYVGGDDGVVYKITPNGTLATRADGTPCVFTPPAATPILGGLALYRLESALAVPPRRIAVTLRGDALTGGKVYLLDRELKTVFLYPDNVPAAQGRPTVGRLSAQPVLARRGDPANPGTFVSVLALGDSEGRFHAFYESANGITLNKLWVLQTDAQQAITAGAAVYYDQGLARPAPNDPWHNTFYFGDAAGIVYTVLDTDTTTTDAHIETSFALDGALSGPLTLDGDGVVLAATERGNVYSLVPHWRYYNSTLPWCYGSPVLKRATAPTWVPTVPAGRSLNLGGSYTVTARCYPRFTGNGQQVHLGFSTDAVPTPFAYLSIIRASDTQAAFQLVDMHTGAPVVSGVGTLNFTTGRSWDDGVEVQLTYGGYWYDGTNYNLFFNAYARKADEHGVFTGGFANVCNLTVLMPALPAGLRLFARNPDAGVPTFRMEGVTASYTGGGGSVPGPYVQWQWNAAVDGKRSRALPLRTAPAPWMGNTLVVGSDDGTVYAIGPRSQMWDAAVKPDTRLTQTASPWPVFHREPRRQGSTELADLCEAGPYSPSLRWLQPHNNITLDASPVVSDRGADRVTRVYSATTDGKVYAHDALTGAPIAGPAWGTGSDGAVILGPTTGPSDAVVRATPAVHTDGKLAVAALDGRLYVYDYKGALQWESNTPPTPPIPPRGNYLASPIFAGLGTDYLVYAATCDTLTTGGRYQRDSGTTLTVLANANNVTLNAGYALLYTIDAGASEYWVTYARVRTQQAGQLQYLQNGTWLPVAAYGAAAAARYITVELNRPASAVKWVNTDTAQATVTGLEVYTAGKVGTPDAVGTPGVDGDPDLQYTPKQPTVGNPVNSTNLLSTSPVDVVDAGGGLFWAYRVKVRTALAYIVSVQDANGLWRQVKSVAAKANPTSGDPKDIPVDEVIIDRTVRAIRWERFNVSEPYTDVNTNGTRDAGEPYTDTNLNGRYDATLDARPTNLYGFDVDVRVMTVNSGGRVYAFASDGTVKWAYPPLDQPAMAPVVSAPALTGTATTGDAVLYLAARDGRVLAFAHDGVATAPTLAWTQHLYDPISAPITVVATPGGNALNLGTEANDLYLLDVNDGGRPMAGWPVHATGPITNASAITADGQGFVPTQTGELLAQTLYGRKYGTGTLTFLAPTYANTDVLYDVNPRCLTLVARVKPTFNAATGNKSVQLGLTNGAKPFDLRITDAGQLRCEPWGATPITNPITIPGGLAAIAANGIELSILLEPVAWADGSTRTRVTGYYRLPDAIGNFTGAFQTINTYVDTAATVTGYYPFARLSPDGDANAAATVDRLTVYQGYRPTTTSTTTTALAPLVQQLLTVGTTVHSAPVIDAQGHLFFGTDSGSLLCVDTLKGTLLWAYTPDRSLIATTLFTDIAEGTTRLPVTAVTGFTAGDAVQIMRSDGSRPETLGTITSIERPINVPSTTLSQKSDTPVLTRVLHLTDVSQVLVGDSIAVLPSYDPATQQAQAMRALGLVTSIDTVAKTITLDTLVPAIDLDGDGTATDAIAAGSPVYITRGYGYLNVSVGPTYKRAAGELISATRGIALPMRTAPAVGKGQLLYVAADDGVLYAIGPSDRAIVPPTLPPLVDADAVSPWYTFHKDNLRTGFAEQPGPVSRVLRWYANTGSTLDNGPSLGFADAANPMGILYLGTADETDTTGIVRQRGALLAYNASTGQLRWRQDDSRTMGRVMTTPSVYVTTRLNALGQGLRDEFVTFGTVDMPDGAQAVLQAVKMADSTVIAPGGAIPFTAPTKYYGFLVEIPTNQAVAAVRVTSGSVSQFSVGQDVFITSAAGTQFEFLGNITAINFAGGDQWWLVFDPGSTHKVRGGETFTDANANGAWEVGEVYVDANGNGRYDAGHLIYNSNVSSHAATEGHLYCVDRQGKIRWRFPNGGVSNGDTATAIAQRGTSIAYLTQLVTAARQYATNNGTLPPYASWATLLAAAPYNVPAAAFTQPLNSLPYVYNKDVAGKALTSFTIPSEVPLFWESQPDATNSRVVAYANGTVTTVTVGVSQNMHIAPVHASPVIDQEGTSYFATDDGVVYAVDIDGYLKWSYAIAAMDDSEATLQTLAAPTLDNTSARLFVSVSAPDANRGYVLALDTQTQSDDKRLLWRRRFGLPYSGEVVNRASAEEIAAEKGGPVTASPTVSTANGYDRVYIGTDNFNGNTGAFYSLDAITGAIVASVSDWPAMQDLVRPQAIGPISSTAAAVDEGSAATYHIIGLVNNGDGTTTLALREGTVGLKVGGRVRVYPTRGVINATITAVAANKRDITVNQVLPITSAKLTTNEQCILVGSQDGRLYAMTEFLEPLWYYGTSGAILTSPAVSTQLASSIDAPTAAGATPVNTLTSGGFFNGIGSVTYHVRIVDGDPVNPNTFEWTDDGWATTHGPTAINAGVSVALSLGVTITFAQAMGFTAGDGWSFTASSTGDRTYQVYFGSNNHLLYAVNFSGTSHNLVWSRDMRDRVFASPIVGMRPSDASPSVVYQASRDHYLYAFGDQLAYDGEPINPDTGPVDTYTPPDEPNPNDPYAMRTPSKPAARKMVENLTGEPYTDANGNGKCDAAEWYYDINGNGQWDVYEEFTDLNGNGEYEVGEPFTDINGNGTRENFNESGDCWWKFVVTVNNAGRGIVDNVKVSDVLPVPLVAPGATSLRLETTTVFTPSMPALNLGTNDLSTLGYYTGAGITDFRVKISAVGAQDAFTWWSSTDGLDFTDPAKVWGPAAGTTVNIPAPPQAAALSDGVYVRFGAQTGHSGNEEWYFRAAPYVVDVTVPTDPTKQSYEINWYADAAKNGFAFYPDLKDRTQPRHQIERKFIFYVKVPEGLPKRDFTITNVTAASNNSTTVTVADTSWLSPGLIVTVCNNAAAPIDVTVMSVDTPTTFTVDQPIDSNAGAKVKLAVRYKLTRDGNVMRSYTPATISTSDALKLAPSEPGNPNPPLTLMKILYLQLFQHPIAQQDLGTQNKNQVVVSYFTYNRETTIDNRPPERAETKVDNAWSSTGDVEVRFYYNGWSAYDTQRNIRLAMKEGRDLRGDERRAFSPWNELETDKGIPYSFSPLTKKSYQLGYNLAYPDGMQIPDQRQVFRKPTQGVATSGFITQLYPRVPRYDINALNRTRIETFTPFAWRSTIRPVWRQIGARPPKYTLTPLAFDERIKLARVVTGGAAVTTLRLDDLSRVKVGHRIVVDNPDGTDDGETYIAAMNAGAGTITVNPAVDATVGAWVRDEWSPDLVIANPIKVTNTASVPLTGVNMGSMAAPGNTTTSPPLRVFSLVSFPGGDNSAYRNPWAIQYRFMAKTVDLRGPTPVSERLARVTDDSMVARSVITVDTPNTLRLFDSVRIVNPWPVPSVEAVVVGVNMPNPGQLTLAQKCVVNQDAVIYRTTPDWNAMLEAITEYNLGVNPTAGSDWDGFRYDPYAEHYVGLSRETLDRPIGPVLLNGRHMDLHLTRTVPAHQPASVVGAVSDTYQTFRDTQTVYYDDLNGSGGWNTGEPIYIVINGTRLSIEDVNANGRWDINEPLFYDVDGDGAHGAGEPYVTPGVFDIRVFVDLNGNRGWDPGEPYYVVMPGANPDYAAWDGTQSPKVMETVLGVAPVTRAQSVTLVTDLGRMPGGASYGLPAAPPTVANSGNTGLVPDATQPTLTASSTTTAVVWDKVAGTTTSALLPRLGATDPHELLRTGSAPTRYYSTANVEAVTWRAGNEVQPLRYERYFESAWRLPKSPAGSGVHFARPYSVPWPSDLTALLRQPTGTYTGTGTLHLKDGDSAARIASDTTTLSLRLGESRFSMTTPANFAITPPGYDYSRHQDPKARFWTAYLTGTESWPLGVVMPGVRNSANPLERDELGVWVCSNTPVVTDTADRTAISTGLFRALLPTAQTDTNLWFRRAKHLVTEPLPVAGQPAPVVQGQTKTLAIPRDVWDQVRCVPADAAGVSASTTDLVVIRVKQKASDAANQAPRWSGYVTRKYYSDPAAGGDGLYRIEATDPWAAEDIDPYDPNTKVDYVVEILAHPWVPIVSPDDMTRLRKLLDDPMNPTGGPVLRFGMPQVTTSGDDIWVAWTVSTVQQVTRIDPVSRAATVNHVPVSYLVYKHFNVNKPWGPSDEADPTNPVIWVGAPSTVLKTDAPTPLPTRTAPVLVPRVESSADSLGRKWQGALMFYESGTPNARGLHFARLRNYLTAATAPAAATAAWQVDNGLQVLNWAFSNTDKPQIWADSTNAGVAESPAHNLNLLLQGTRADGNTDLYFARLTVRQEANPLNDPAEPIVPALVMQPVTTPEADPTTGILVDKLKSSQANMLYLPGDALAWVLYVDPADTDPRRVRLDLTGTKPVTGTTYTTTLSLKHWVELPAAQPAGILPDDIRDYVLEGLMDGRPLRVLFNPYNGTVRILASPYPITAATVTGLPRLQRLTSHLGADVNPIVDVERWRYKDDAGTKVFGGDGSLQTRPRVWLYWTRMHDDGLGPRVYARPYRLTPVGGSTVRMDLRMDDSGVTPPGWNHAVVTANSTGTEVTVNSTLGYQTGMRVNLGTQRNEMVTVVDGITLRFTHAVTANAGDQVVPIFQRYEADHLLPMETLTADGSIFIVRQAGLDTPTVLANSPEAGLWVLSTANRDLTPNYPGSDPTLIHHDLFLQVLNDPTVD
jgi:VCBS repeat-containing protein